MKPLTTNNTHLIHRPMKIASATLSLCLVWVATAHAQFPPEQQGEIAPVYVEPYQADPWSNASPDDVVLVDAPGLPETGALYPEPSAAQQDLGNLIPPGARPGFFQKANLDFSWMPRFESDSVGVSKIETSIVTAIPFPRRHQPLTIKPRYSVRFLDGPDFIDVPARLHDADVTFNHIRRIADRWVLNAAVTMGSYADDHSFDAGDAFRMSGRALGIYEASAHSKWIVGVVYLNRAGTTVVPAAGYLYWTDDLQIDVVLPQPKIAWRTWSDGRSGYNERWFYVQGDLGGGVWAVERADGSPDTLSYSDLRVIFGTERKQIGGISRRWEVGYVFARELSYDSMGHDLEIDDTMIVRAAFTY
ncbi:DUF6268 family outer membrane beta-barrel protein [Aeoliella sp. ICT_H6.2]|uniref:DUF6268 family outer membrane beta-barrel protein n=1 Tax=Aeoliella straminimaris TaxID=2954799 RepID=A0A9X2FJU7_9BACT|nr:DUF6268 family outer membrane beta-barrel protein [Aeoliella straminimaris]MCO6047911.1 DUF6268 family outer membrane beta-barrel protein [Aeoliella straminimaris]